MRGEDSHHTVLKRDWSAAVTPPIFVLRFQQARQRLRFCLCSLREAILVPTEKDAKRRVFKIMLHDLYTHFLFVHFL